MASAGRRGPGGRGAGLTADDIVEAALAAMDRHGVEWLTMRRLAAELGVTPGALYWHFPNKDALCAAIVDQVALDLQWDDDPGGTPRDRLTRHLVALRAHWRRHPALVALGRRFRPVGSGEFSRSGCATLAELGFDDSAALQHWRALVWLVLGFHFVEEGVASSAHHARVADAPDHFSVSIDGTAEVLDTGALFDHLLAMTLDGIEQDARRRREYPGAP